MLSVQNINVSLGKTKILNDVSFDVVDGNTVGIIGPNGSGKTTLFNAISGFVPVQSGRILANNKEIQNLLPYQRARMGVLRVFQNPGIFKQLTVLENITIALNAKLSIWQSFTPNFSGLAHTKVNKEKAVHVLSLVGLDSYLDKRAGELSGGQMRLLEMARCLAVDSSIYLLDEPTAGVSPRLKDEVSLAINKLIKLKKIILIIEHDMNFIRTFVDRIIVLEQGKVFMDDKPDLIMQSEQLRQIYFGG